MNDELTGNLPKVLDRILARSGGILHIGVLGREAPLDKIVDASFRCYVRDSEEMIFAIPLEMSAPDRSVQKGANVFDFSIQGHYSGDDKLKLRNFDYIFRMGPNAASDYAASYPDAANASNMPQLVESWLNSIRDLPSNDTSSSAEDLAKFDSIFSNVVHIRIFAATGDVISTDVKLSSAGTAQWLANYLL